MLEMDKGDIKRANSRLKRLVSAYEFEGGNALPDGADVVMSRSVPRTPFKTGKLRDSAFKGDLPRRGLRGEQYVDMGYSAPYAMEVHEAVDRNFVTGQAKFLEQPLFESVPEIVKLIKARIERVNRKFRRAG